MPLPIFPLNTVLFPGIPLPLRIFEDRYLRMIADRAAHDPVFGVALIESGREVGDQPSYHRIGTTARLISLNKQSAHRVEVVVMGTQRVRLGDVDWSRGYAMADTEDVSDVAFDTEEAAALMSTAAARYERYLTGVARVVGLDFDVPLLSTNPQLASFEIASRLPLHTWEQQALLEDDDPTSRMRSVVRFVTREVALLYKGGLAGIPINFPGDRFTLN